MKVKHEQSSRPPQAPDVERKLKFHLLQMIGAPFILLVPLLALFGVFGESIRSASAASPALDMRVEYPSRFRYKMVDSLTVYLSNTSPQSIPGVRVRVDQAYVDSFSAVVFSPSVQYISGAAYVVDIGDLQPGETRLLTVRLQAEDYGMHRGTVSATPEGGAELRVAISTFVFP